MQNVWQDSQIQLEPPLIHQDNIPQISYRTVLDSWVDDSKHAESTVKNVRTALNLWLTFHGKTMECLVGEEMGAAHEEHFTQLLQEQPAPKRSSRHGDNVRWAIGRIRKSYQALLLDLQLPTDFLPAITALRMRKGWQVSDLTLAYAKRRALSSKSGAIENIGVWLSGKASPRGSSTASKLGIQALEEIFELREGVLSSRAFKSTPVAIMKPGKTSAYRLNHSRLTKSRYTKDLPEHIEAAFAAHAAWKFKNTYRVGGEVYTVKKGNFWTSDETIVKYKKDLRDFFGFLRLPAPTKPEYLLTSDEKMLLGKGFSDAEVRYTMMLDPDLLYEFFEFRKNRQTNKVYTQQANHFLIFVNNMVNHPYSFVRAHEVMFRPEVPGLSADQWQEHCDRWHHDVLKLNRQVKLGISDDKQRDPDEALSVILADRDPFALVEEMIRRMRASIASRPLSSTRACIFRDALLFDLMLSEPLRASHWGQLELGKDFIRAENGIWTLVVDKEAFKNKASKWCKNRSTRFTPKLSLLIDEYVDGHRAYLAGGNEPENTRVFLSAKTGPGRAQGKGHHPYALTEATLFWAVARRFETYFHVRIGTNAFRHILATAYLKEHPGDYEGAASILNNSPDVIKENYGHVKQADHLRRANNWRDEKRRTFEKKTQAKAASYG